MYIYTMKVIKKKMLAVKLDEQLIKKIDKETIKRKRTRHYLMVEALEKEFK